VTVLAVGVLRRFRDVSVPNTISRGPFSATQLEMRSWNANCDMAGCA
jgi:hypothetical protein